MRLAQRDYQVVVIDMKLPESNGTKILQMVQDDNPCARTLIITGFAREMNESVREALTSGADAICYKPFDVDHLLKTVKELST
jgi:DNA-binding NarL/FixJ family response regulator